MIKLPSLQHSYSLVWSRDPALSLEWYEDSPDLAPEQNAEARAKVDNERARLLRVAQQTGNWQAITKPGEQPTAFTFRQIDERDVARIHGDAEREQLGELEIQHVFFLTAIESISNLPGVEVKRARGSKIADPKLIESLSALNHIITNGCTQLISEFVTVVIARARGAIDPLS